MAMNNCGSCWHFLEEECTNKSACNNSDDVHFVDSRASGCKLYKRSKLSDKCIEYVVEWCRNNEQRIRNEFVPPLTDKQFAFTLDAKNWFPFERTIKGKSFHMAFDNEELNSQLRAYTVTRGNTIAVHVQGE